MKNKNYIYLFITIVLSLYAFRFIQFHWMGSYTPEKSGVLITPDDIGLVVKLKKFDQLNGCVVYEFDHENRVTCGSYTFIPDNQ